MTITMDSVECAVADFAASRGDTWIASACGVTRAERRIRALVDRGAYESGPGRVRVLVVGGLSGEPDDVEIALAAVRHFAGAGERLSSSVALSAIPCGNPGGLALGVGPSNGSGGTVSEGYPPQGGFFDHHTSPEARYLWRWICYQAPDLVLDVRAGSQTTWEANDAADGLGEAFGAGAAGPADSLVAALGREAGDSPGTIPALRLTAPPGGLVAELERLYGLLQSSAPGPSAARAALDARRSRSAVEVGRDLAKTNGRTLEPLIYVQGVAISGRLRLASLDPAGAGGVDDVAPLVEHVVADLAAALGDDPDAPTLAALVWAEEMASLTGDRRYTNALIAAMTRFRARGAGEAPHPLNPAFIVEDYFFSSAVIGPGARAMGDTNAASYMSGLTEFLLTAGLQESDGESNGLFRHSREGPFHWGRGNGFAAMGLAEAITYMPGGWPRRTDVIAMYTRLMQVLRPLQEPSGMYLQVIDYPGSYQELTATCMIGYAMARGIRLGVLDDGYRPTIERAWLAAIERVDAEGNVVDGCTGTGVMHDLRSYLDRPANSGYDDRTGSMALVFAAEMARLTL